jgi:hypothetical protein
MKSKETTDTTQTLLNTVPPDLDGTNPEYLFRVYMAMERTMKEDQNIFGTVDFTILDNNDLITAVIRAKVSGPQFSLYQSASYMVLADEKNRATGFSRPLWGIITNYEVWYFLKLDEKKHISVSEPIGFAVNKVFHGEALDVYAFLFEIMGIPVDFEFT